MAACLATQLKWAVNLSGGFHHASSNQGGGFCIYPDISFVVHYLKTRLDKRKIMIVDLDLHQGNGYQRDLREDNEIYIVDFYHHGIQTQDFQAREAIKRDIIIDSHTTDELSLIHI